MQISWQKRVAGVLIGLAVYGLTACAAPAPPLGLPPEAEGLDLSHHNGRVDWAAVGREPLDFVYLKATEGKDHKDPRFQAHWRAARAEGFATGAYHFYRLCLPGGVQAANFIQSVEVSPSALPPAADLEYDGNCQPYGTREEMRAELRLFLEALETEYGQRPVLYTTADFHRDWIAGHFDDYPLWIRKLDGEPKGDYALWQYSMKGRVKGIGGFVDRNRTAPER
jgi:lysozyme